MRLTDEFIDRHLHIFGESAPEWMHVLVEARKERDEARAQVAALRYRLNEINEVPWGCGYDPRPTEALLAKTAESAAAYERRIREQAWREGWERLRSIIVDPANGVPKQLREYAASLDPEPLP